MHKILLYNVDFISLKTCYIHKVASSRIPGYSYRESSIGKIYHQDSGAA